jgi:hypothetical protein
MGNRVTIKIRFRAGDVSAITRGFRAACPTDGYGFEKAGQRYEGWLDAVQRVGQQLERAVRGFDYGRFRESCTPRTARVRAAERQAVRQ